MTLFFQEVISQTKIQSSMRSKLDVSTQVQWHMPIVPPTWEAEAGALGESRNSSEPGQHSEPLTHTLKKEYKLNTLVCSGCCNKVSQSEWLKQQKLSLTDMGNRNL